MSGPYGSVDAQRDDVTRRTQRPSLFAVALCAVAVTIVASLFIVYQGDKMEPVGLEEEISSFGTGVSTKERNDADNEYEATFNDDPGHISRAELRFNKALQAAGGLSRSHVVSDKPYYEDEDAIRFPEAKSSGQQNLKQWTAYPDNGKDSGTVNIVINNQKKHAKQADNRLGMSSLAARKDLESYFDSLGSQIHSQERKHVSEVLQRLSSGDDASSSSSSWRGTSASHKTESGSRKQRRHKDTSMLRLLQKAMRSQEFAQEVKDLKAELHVGWHT